MLFVMCHPDDEIFIGATIQKFVREGAEVSLAWTHELPVRRAEAITAAKLFPVPEDRLHFFGGRDGAIIDDYETVFPQLKATIDEIAPDRVLTVAFEQGHIDHDATNLFVNLAFQGPVYEWPMYFTYLTRTPLMNRFADPVGEELRRLNSEERELKKRLAQAFPSQTIWRNIVWYQRWRRLVFDRADLLGEERLRLQTHRNWTEPNLPEPLKQRVQQSPTWARWTSSVSELLTEL